MSFRMNHITPIFSNVNVSAAKTIYLVFIASWTTSPTSLFVITRRAKYDANRYEATLHNGWASRMSVTGIFVGQTVARFDCARENKVKKWAQPQYRPNFDQSLHREVSREAQTGIRVEQRAHYLAHGQATTSEMTAPTAHPADTYRGALCPTSWLDVACMVPIRYRKRTACHLSATT